MRPRTQGYLVIALLALLLVVVALDPRVPTYRSQYEEPAPEREVRKWAQDIKAWRSSPTWERFKTERGVDFRGSYIFGKYDYRIDLQIRGDRLHYISWGSDNQKDGGAWYAVGEGTVNERGEWFSVWSCLDISRGVSNGGGAWFRFSRDRRRIDVRYYHDTLPFGERPIETGEAVLVNLKPGEEMPADRASVLDSEWVDRPLEGRVRTFTETVEAPADFQFVLWGRVVDESGEGIEGAAVKRRAAGRIETVTDARGFFRLELEKLEALTPIAAGKLGYVNGIVTLEQETAFSAIGPEREHEKVALVTIVLREMDRTDYVNYEWVSPLRLSPASYDPAQHLNCGNCHRREFDDWKTSRHATMARNTWTRAAFERDARPSAQARGDNEDQCTPCHSPSLASKLDRFHLNGRTMPDARGVDLEGNHCDFCHKIEAITDPQRPGMNGSIRLLRPNPDDDVVPGSIKRVFGPLPDVSFLYMGAGYNPIFEMGVLCAGCHEHVTGDGLVASGTASEWRQSKYSQPGADYKTCQSCHMPQYSAERTVMVPGPDGRPQSMTIRGDMTDDEVKGGGVQIASHSTRYRPLSEAHKHSFVGTEDQDFLRAGVSMEVAAEPLTDGLRVRVTLTNTGAGHAIPTGHGLKRYVLAVTGRSRGENLATGTDLPVEERVGAAADATRGAIIGKRFSGAGGADWALPWWRADKLDQDTRLWPDKPQEFVFDIPGADVANVKLVLRRGSPALLRSHGVDVNSGKVAGASLDTVVHERTVKP
jgi:hypothetical protein